MSFGTLQASVFSSNDGLIGFNGVLAAHLLSIDAGHLRTVVTATCITRRWDCNAQLHRQTS